MGDWYGTAALILAILLFFAGVRVWENRAVWTNPSPTPPPQPELDLAPQVSDVDVAPSVRQGRGTPPRIETLPNGVKGAWLNRWDDDDDD